eukprot:403372566
MNQIKQHIKDKRVTQPLPQPPLLRGYKKCDTCYQVTAKIEMVQNAEFECLNCNLLICRDCLDIHFQNPKNEQHRVLKLLDNGMYEKTENDFCEEHRERLKYYCFTDDKPLCIVCANYENHKGHFVKMITQIVEEQERLKQELQVKITKMIQEVEKNIGFFKTAKEAILKQKNLYIEKLRADFEVMFKMLEKKYSEMFQKIEKAFQNSLKESVFVQAGFNSFSQRLNYLQSVNPQRDLDTLLINQLSDDILNLEIDLKFFNDFDISESVFLNEPQGRLDVILNDYDFRDVSQRHLKHLRYCFIESKILDGKTYINNELYIMFPKIKSTELLYRMRRDACSPEIFHKKCDNKGATLLFVKTNTGYIFGGYNPTSWLSQYCYQDCDDAFLFSIHTPNSKRPPFKCPVKKDKSEYAIKNAETGYSPGFGEANNCDLFIAFKNPTKSYCKLGNVYQPPFQYSNLPQNEIYGLLAGTQSNWEIEEIEVYSVKVQDNLDI